MIEGHVDGPNAKKRDVMVKISWASTDRASDVDILQAARGCAARSGNRAILDHLPEVLFAEDYSTTLSSDMGRTRTLRVIVMERFCPMATIETLHDFAKVMTDVVEC